VIQFEMLQDERGSFLRTFCAEAFERHGLNPQVVQCSSSLTRQGGTIRGLHYQAAPHMEDKLVRCTRGSAYDVIVDLRPASKTYKKWFAIELRADGNQALYVPKGFAHGYQTLVDDTEMSYQMSEFYRPESARGVRWNDQAFAIVWPRSEVNLLKRDAEYPDYLA